MSARRLVVALVTAAVVAVAGSAAYTAVKGPAVNHVTAFFPRTVGLYVGNDVRILGIKVGKVIKITPMGTDVRVELTYDAHDQVPASAGAAIVPPSIVSDRYVQLTPAYTGGPAMADGAVIPLQRTEVPVELDQIFSNLNDLNKALGPKGANKNGALSRLLAVSAKNLGGNGARLHNTLNAFGSALSTLSDNRGNLFSTLAHLQQFTTTLARDNPGVLAVNNDLSQVSVQLNGERADLAAALHQLQVALGQVSSFVADNKTALTSDVSGLASISQTLVNEKTSIQELLDVAPLALQNLSLAYDAKYHTLDTRSNENALPPSTLVCSLFAALGAKSCPVAGGPPGLPSTTSSALTAPSSGAVTMPAATGAGALGELMGGTR